MSFLSWCLMLGPFIYFRQKQILRFYSCDFYIWNYKYCKISESYICETFNPLHEMFWTTDLCSCLRDGMIMAMFIVKLKNKICLRTCVVNANNDYALPSGACCQVCCCAKGQRCAHNFKFDLKNKEILF